MSFPNENKRETNVKCRPPWLGYEEYFSRQHPKTALNDIFFLPFYLIEKHQICFLHWKTFMKKECIKELSKKSFVNTLNYVKSRIQAEKGHLSFYKTLQIKLLPLPATARQFTLRSISQVQHP